MNKLFGSMITILLYSSSLIALPISRRLIFKKSTEKYLAAMAKRNKAACGVWLLDDTVVAGAYNAADARLFQSMSELRKSHKVERYIERQALYHRPWIMDAENIAKCRDSRRYCDIVNTAFKFWK